MRQRRHKEAKLLVAFLDAINVNSRFAERYFERCGLCSSFSLHRVQLSGISVNADFGKAGWKRWGTSLLAFRNPSRVTEDSLTISRGWPHFEAGRCDFAFFSVSARCRLRPKKAMRRHPRSPHLFIFKQGGRPFLSI